MPLASSALTTRIAPGLVMRARRATSEIVLPGLASSVS
jgi:hypothetical protein